jgi:hypothetical protein
MYETLDSVFTNQETEENEVSDSMNLLLTRFTRFTWVNLYYNSVDTLAYININ